MLSGIILKQSNLRVPVGKISRCKFSCSKNAFMEQDVSLHD